MTISRLAVLASAIVLAQSSHGFGSSRPKDAVLAAAPAGRLIKKVVHIDSLNAKQILSNGDDGKKLENLLAKQYITLLIQSGRYSITVQQDSGRGTVSLSPQGDIQIAHDNAIDLMASNDGSSQCRFPDQQFEFSGDVLSFEVTDKNGLTLGFNPGAALWGIGAGFSFLAQTSAMALHLDAMDGYKQRILAASDVTSKQSQLQINANISYLQFVNMSYQYYSQTPLARVAKNALTLGINGLNKSIDGLPWTGRVLTQDGGKYVLLNVGQDAGVKVGDAFTVYNATPSEDPQCFGAPQPSGKPGAPLASVKVYDVGITSSWAEVSSFYQQGSLSAGSRVAVEQLAP